MYNCVCLDGWNLDHFGVWAQRLDSVNFPKDGLAESSQN